LAVDITDEPSARSHQWLLPISINPINLRRKSMSIQKISIALVSVLAVTAGIPAMAQTRNTSDTYQDSVQTNEIRGRRNTGTNTSTQRSTTNQSGRRTTNDSNTTQYSDQLNDIKGKRNTGTNTNTQRSNTRQRR
jgi:hypothetical protein